MIYLNLLPIFEAKGIDNPNHFLYKNGFTRHTAHNLLNNKTAGINFSHLERLCLVLGCSPNDLLAWNDTDQNNPLSKEPLYTLKKAGSKGSITQTLYHLPVSKLEQLRNFLDNLSQTGTTNT